MTTIESNPKIYLMTISKETRRWVIINVFDVDHGSEYYYLEGILKGILKDYIDNSFVGLKEYNNVIIDNYKNSNNNIVEDIYTVTINGEKHFMSLNHSKLSGLCGFANRVCC